MDMGVGIGALVGDRIMWSRLVCPSLKVDRAGRAYKQKRTCYMI